MGFEASLVQNGVTFILVLLTIRDVLWIWSWIHYRELGINSSLLDNSPEIIVPIINCTGHNHAHV